MPLTFFVSKINVCELENAKGDEIRTSGAHKRKRMSDECTEEVTIDFSKHPTLQQYCRMISASQAHHIEEDAQYARHSIEILKWSCVDHGLFLEAGWKGRSHAASFSLPCISLGLVTAVFSQHSNEKLHSAVVMLNGLQAKGKVLRSDFDYMSPLRSIQQLINGHSKNCHEIDVLTVVSVISLHAYAMSWSCKRSFGEPRQSRTMGKNIFGRFRLISCKFYPRVGTSSSFSG